MHQMATIPISKGPGLYQMATIPISKGPGLTLRLAVNRHVTNILHALEHNIPQFQDDTTVITATAAINTVSGSSMASRFWFGCFCKNDAASLRLVLGGDPGLVGKVPLRVQEET